MIATTIEQSKRLIAAGIDPKTSDMCWALPFAFGKDPNDIAPMLYVEPYCSADIAPAWSLSALIKLCGWYSFSRIANLCDSVVGKYNFEKCFQDIVDYLCDREERRRKIGVPSWCGYPKDLCCMSLSAGYVTGEDYCKDCDAYKGNRK